MICKNCGSSHNRFPELEALKIRYPNWCSPCISEQVQFEYANHQQWCRDNPEKRKSIIEYQKNCTDQERQVFHAMSVDEKLKFLNL
jgi:hypothetical protein